METDFDVYRNRVICSGVTTRELQEKSLEIFKYFQKICEENGLRYWCGGGTCIGALRHGGFIPWDDDIDVFMPRPDYEKLYAIWDRVADTERYALCRTTKEKNIHQTDMQLVDKRTTFINRNSMNEDIMHGVSIDVMPFEGCPDGKIARMMQIYHAVLYSIFNVQRLPDHQGKLLRFLTKLVLGSVKSPERRYKIWKKHEKKLSAYDYDAANYVKEAIVSFRALFWPWPKAYFDTEEASFEDMKVRVPKNADAYMTRIFGDYMRLPPEEGRVAKHDIVYMNMNEPYIKFKGVYYCRADGKAPDREETENER